MKRALLLALLLTVIGTSGCVVRTDPERHAYYREHPGYYERGVYREYPDYDRHGYHRDWR
ncbi:MAG TPA: hypothetical protein VGE41_06635 [Verrucomicrobiae bacterium]|jgi:hypothetical protein